jgi:serine/threonine protein kinase
MLGRYRLVREIGGGMGSVYEAEDTLLGRPVAIKVPHLERDDRPKVVERFRREAAIASRIDHPNICRVYDFGEIDGLPYLVMPFLEGTTLDRSLQGEHVWPAREAVELVRTVALALQVIHGRGAIHRDLKPANIMLQDGQPIILDFGLARALGGDGGLTTTGRAVGTPAYIAPEQLAPAEEARGAGCDIYSLGVILYELLTRQLPFTGDNLHQVYYQILSVQPRPPSEVRSGLDGALDGICLKAMAKKPEDRYRTMAEFATALEAYLWQEQAANVNEELESGEGGAEPKEDGDNQTATGEAGEPGPNDLWPHGPFQPWIPPAPAQTASAGEQGPQAERPRKLSAYRALFGPIAEMRQRLLDNPDDVGLRKRYLAVRTPELKREDRRMAGHHRPISGAVRAAVILGMLFGLILGGGLGLVSTEDNKLLVEIGGMIGLPTDLWWGRVWAGAIGFALLGAFLLAPWQGWLARAELNDWSNLGPLPATAYPLSLKEAREQYLGTP